MCAILAAMMIAALVVWSPLFRQALLAAVLYGLLLYAVVSAASAQTPNLEMIVANGVAYEDDCRGRLSTRQQDILLFATKAPGFDDAKAAAEYLKLKAEIKRDGLRATCDVLREVVPATIQYLEAIIQDVMRRQGGK
jgi:hypothetical protein